MNNFSTQSTIPTNTTTIIIYILYKKGDETNMKLVCEKDVILKAINSVTKAVASKTTMPILEGILIQTND